MNNLYSVAEETVKELEGLSEALTLLLGATLASDELNKITQKLKTSLANDDSQDTINYLAKWVERGLFDKSISPKDALETIAHYPSMPFNNGRWDVDHKPYAQAFYQKFPKAREKTS
jgi:hypothetical protein